MSKDKNPPGGGLLLRVSNGLAYALMTGGYLRRIPDNRIDLVVTGPPYGLVSTTTITRHGARLGSFDGSPGSLTAGPAAGESVKRRGRAIERRLEEAALSGVN